MGTRVHSLIQRILQWTIFVVSAGFNALLLLGIGISASEYRPSGKQLIQQGVVSLLLVTLCTGTSLYLLVRPRHSSLVGNSGMLAGLALALTLFFRESWVWDATSEGLALAAAVSVGTSILAMARSSGKRE